MDTIEEKNDLQVFQLLMETGELESKQRTVGNGARDASKEVL